MRDKVIQAVIQMGSKLPLPILYVFSKPLYVFLYYIVQFKKQNVINNISLAFPNKNNSEQAALVRAFYKNYSNVLLETIRLQTMSVASIQKHVRIQNKEILNDYLNNGHSVLVSTSHQCNIDWLILAASIEFNHPLYFIHKSVKNKTIEQLIIKIRSRFGAKPIFIGSSLREIISRKKAPRIIAIASDQSPLKKGDAYWLPFLGRETAFHVGIDKIATLTHFPVFFISMERVKRGEYLAKITQLTEPSSKKTDTEGEITKMYAQLLEKQILSAPEDWLWINRRWKKRKSTSAS